MVAVSIYVEGGGDDNAQRSRCREGFRRLLERVVVKGAQPRIIACGSRREAFKSFKLACENPAEDTTYLLLVDAEDPVAVEHGPWKHVATRQGDGWERPATATDDSLHFMAVTTETWLIADPVALAAYYGKGFRQTTLPTVADLESVSKSDVNGALARATKPTKKKRYEKSHGWELVGRISPDVIRRRCPRFGRRFLDHLAKLAR